MSGHDQGIRIVSMIGDLLTCPMAQMRDRIVLAAKARFHHYGLGKTTMAEIANDLGMSPGNLYRYYPGKLDIAAEIARRAYNELNEQLREELRKPSTSFSQKLRDLMMLQLHRTHAMIEMSPKVMELAQFISRERPDLGNERLHACRSILAECLAQGNAAGEFDIADVITTAEMLQTATHIFCFPQLWSHLTLDKLERELNGVMDLILNGMRKRTSAIPAAIDTATATAA